MSIYLLLSVYFALIIAVSLLGGYLPSLLRMTHLRIQLIMSFVAGLMLGIAFYHLLPHAVQTLGGGNSIDDAVWWLMVGLLLMFVLLRAFHFHQPDMLMDEHQPTDHRLSWVGLAIGLTLHSLIDGIALAAAVQAEMAAGLTTGLFGIGVFLAILLHKPLSAMSITALMRAGGWSNARVNWVNAAFALTCPLGVLLFFSGVELVADDRERWIGAALAFSAGTFICVSLSDLLPEVRFHRHDRGKLTVALLLGIVLAYSLGWLEADLHHHDHNHSQDRSYVPYKLNN